MSADLKPAVDRRKHTQWGAAPFPNAVSPDKVITFCPFDAFVIPRGSKHKREAFEFVAYVNRQEVMEKLCAMHCKNSPLAKVSENFINNHPNPYIEVFEDAANAPGAFSLPQLPIWPEVADLLNSDVSQSCYLLAETADIALTRAAKRLEGRWGYYRTVQEDRARESN
jgi:multiple sugar transport system substrate-binding protein